MVKRIAATEARLTAKSVSKESDAIPAKSDAAKKITKDGQRIHSAGCCV